MATFANNHGYLRVQFRWQGRRYRFGLGLRDTRDNRRLKKQWLAELNVALRQDSFRISHWFTGAAAGSGRESPLTTLATYARQWLEHQTLSPQTRRDYEYLFRVFIDRTSLAQTPVAHLTKHTIQLSIKNKSSDRSKRFLQLMRSIAEDAIDDGYLSKNPAERIRNPKRDKPRKDIVALTASEQTALRAVSDKRDRWIIGIMLSTGVRPSEALRIQRQDIDLKRKRLLVRQSKTSDRPRVTELQDIQVFEEILASNIIGPIITGIKWGTWRRHNWPRILANLGIAYREPYAMKHSCAIRWLEQGRDPVWIAKQLGHTSPQMVWRHYGRFVTEKAVGL